MEIFHISAECNPVAKQGDLADGISSLCKHQKLLGHQPKVVVPFYDNIFAKENVFEEIYSGELHLGWFRFSFTVLKEKTNKLGFDLFQIAIPELFDRPNIYSYEDDTERFVAFQIAFLDWISKTNQKSDIIHCHEHHTGLIPFMVKHCFSFFDLKDTPTVLTIYNEKHQGAFSSDKLNYLPTFDQSKIGLLEWNGMINPLASAIRCVWKITTISPSYLDDICSNTSGLENLLHYEKQKAIGILNGIDTRVWNPKTDSLLIENYSIENFQKGKQMNKEYICEQFNLDISKPLFVFIGNLTPEKGADILPEICSVVLNNHPKEINILILGKGNPVLEKSLQGLKNFYSGNYNSNINYNEKLEHLVFASADFLLMPSRVEPCGTNQMIALHYGTIPIVRRTGGLKDTVLDIGDGGFGICHDQTNIFDVNHSIKRAITLYNDTSELNAIRKIAMEKDHSWENVAKKYIKTYESLTT